MGRFTVENKTFCNLMYTSIPKTRQEKEEPASSTKQGLWLVNTEGKLAEVATPYMFGCRAIPKITT